MPGNRLGFLLTPGNRNNVASIGLRWAADNGAYSGFDPDAFRRMLNRIQGVPECLFVALPDVVGNAFATWRLFDQWIGIVSGMGFPPALVLQDGAEGMPVAWDQIAAVFVGGSTKWKLGESTKWKLGESAAQLCREARRRGKWVHMGRVNSLRRIRHAHAIGCHSVDGSSATRWGDKYLPQYVRWMNQVVREKTLFS
jgi:hypothetical protein